MSYPSLRLTYFAAAGTAEPSRLALHYAGIPFEDVRLTREEFAALKPTLPLGQVPILEVDGKVISQSDAILRYAGKLSKTYPTDLIQAANVEEVLLAIVELGDQIRASGELPEEEKKAHRQGVAKDKLPRIFGFFEKRLASSKSGFFVGETPTIADFKLYASIQPLRNNVYDHLPGSLLDSYPNVLRLQALVRSLPQLASYFSRSSKSFPSLKLTYFDVAGRAEPIRLVLKYGGVPFVDERLKREEFGAFKAAGRFPFGQVPILEVNGALIAQSDGILRYAGSLSGLYPTNFEDALEVDHLIESVNDITGKFGGSAYLPNERKKAEREKVVEKEFPRIFGAFEKRLAASSSGFLGQRISIADFKLFGLVGAIRAGGTLDFVPTDSLNSYTAVIKHFETIKSLPQLAAHFAPPASSSA